jgi:AraC family transcriptional activator of pobA
MTTLSHFLHLQKTNITAFNQYYASPLYHIFLLNGNGTIYVDEVAYTFDGHLALFLTPYQQVKLVGTTISPIEKLAFHGDFYCIEYHKQEVACNGLLFNNIYQQPFIELTDNEIPAIFEKIALETAHQLPHTEPVLKTYLQLILAMASRVKRLTQESELPEHALPLASFRTLLENNFISQRTPMFYAQALSMTPNHFTKQITKHYRKSPSKLIQERVILEAKKLLHLSHKSSKEIASVMNFDDQHYFSRYFKKYTGVSPTEFRKQVGISIMADLSIT